MDGAVELYQIYFKEAQKSDLFPFATPYFNDRLTVFFENSVIAEVVPKCKADKVAVCSYALKKKLNHGIPMRQEFTESLLHEDFDVLSFGRRQKDHFMLAKMDAWHPGSRQILNRIFEILGKEVPREPDDVFYSNHFMARTEIYKAYVRDLLIPAMYLMEHDKEIRPRAYEDSQYFKLKTDPGYPKLIKEQLGLDYVPLHTFLCERLFSCYVNGKSLKIKYL